MLNRVRSFASFSRPTMLWGTSIGGIKFQAEIRPFWSVGLNNSSNSIRSLASYVLHGGPSSDGIPSRVMVGIDQHEAAAERLIGWVQLAIVVFFAALYMIAPRAEGASGENFVPITLAAYFVFTVLRVILSYRMTLPSWYLILSIIVDVMLLCGLIFSFHIQYMQQHNQLLVKNERSHG